MDAERGGGGGGGGGGSIRIQRYCRGTQGAFGGCGGRLGNSYARQKAMNEVGGTNGGSGLV